MSQAAAAAAGADATGPLVIGRYALFDELAAGGMATVHLGRLLGPVGFGRTVAVKRLHPHYLKDQEFITMFMDEARIVARIRHPNVVPMVDVVQNDLGLFLVMEYVHGESLSRLMRTARKIGEPIPTRIVATIMCGVLHGLHAAHETKGPDGELLGVVHRDVSPQNVIVGADGTARVLDFGIAKAAGRSQVTREGQIKGKLAYMAPEQIRGQVDRRTDVFAAAVVLWEMLSGRRLHEGCKDIDIVTRVVHGKFPPPSRYAPGIDADLDAIVMHGLASDPKNRAPTARALALELQQKIGLASPSEVSIWVETLAEEVLEARTSLVVAMELASADLVALDSNPPPPSLALPVNVFPPPAQIPIDLDPSHVSTEAPSSSAVFAQGVHSQAAYPQAPPEQRPVEEYRLPGLPSYVDNLKAISPTVWVAFSALVVLALIGMLLGAYAISHRSSSPTTPAEPATTDSTSSPVIPSASVVAPPAVTATAVVPTPSSALELDDNPSLPEAAQAAQTAQTAQTAQAVQTAQTAATAATAPAATPTNAQPPAGRPALLPPPGGAKKKASCEPPYTLDEQNHRHYKPECMGLE